MKKIELVVSKDAIPKEAYNTATEKTVLMRRGLLMARAVEHKMRSELIAVLRTYKEPPTVEALFEKHEYTMHNGRRYVNQAEMSQALAILRRAGLVTSERRGKNIHYTVNELQVRRIEQLLLTMGKLAPSKIDMDDSKKVGKFHQVRH
jgi:DNA-binding transcriptional ArsR family regulator